MKNKADLVRLIGRSNVGESNLILENSDWIALIAPEYDHEGNKYLGMQRVKSRYYIAGDMYCAFMPYVNGTVKFIEDFYSPVPVHKITMKEEVQLNTGNISNNTRGIVNDITEFTEINNVKLPKGEDNIFLNANAVVAYNLESMRNNYYTGMINYVNQNNNLYMNMPMKDNVFCRVVR